MKKVHKFCVLAGVTLVGMLVLSMLMGAWMVGADDTTPTVTVGLVLEFAIPATATLGVDPDTSDTDVLAVTVKSNAAWQVTVIKDGDLDDTATGLKVIPSAYFTLLTDGAATTFDGEFPTPAQVCLADARGSYTSNFTYEIDLTGVWTVDADTYDAIHTYTASNP